MSKLKLCPFCAREAEVIMFHKNCFAVACKCGAESPRNSKSKPGAIRIWNRRRLAIIETNKIKILNSFKK